MKKEQDDPFPISVMELTSGDIEGALSTFDADIQEALTELIWDTTRLNKIALRVRKNIGTYYVGYDLPGAIMEVLKEEIEEVRAKRSFLSGIKTFIKRGK